MTLYLAIILAGAWLCYFGSIIGTTVTEIGLNQTRTICFVVTGLVLAHEVCMTYIF